MPRPVACRPDAEANAGTIPLGSTTLLYQSNSDVLTLAVTTRSWGATSTTRDPVSRTMGVGAAGTVAVAFMGHRVRPGRAPRGRLVKGQRGPSYPVRFSGGSARASSAPQGPGPGCRKTLHIIRSGMSAGERADISEPHNSIRYVRQGAGGRIGSSDDYPCSVCFAGREDFENNGSRLPRPEDGLRGQSRPQRTAWSRACRPLAWPDPYFHGRVIFQQSDCEFPRASHKPAAPYVIAVPHR
jgi:hypothetical protein